MSNERDAADLSEKKEKILQSLTVYVPLLLTAMAAISTFITPDQIKNSFFLSGEMCALAAIAYSFQLGYKPRPLSATFAVAWFVVASIQFSRVAGLITVASQTVEK